MVQYMKISAIAAAAGMCLSAHAGTIELSYTGIVGGSNAAQVQVDSTTYLAGHMTHTVTSGYRAGQTFNTFCIELGEYAASGSATYEIVDLADAPNPGTSYGQAMADSVSAIVANAYAMGWIDAQLQATDTEDANYLAKMGAIQVAIWEALGHSFDVDNAATSSSVRVQYGMLTNENSFDSSLRMNGLRAIVANGQQDQLIVVPLPSAALAGLGLLGGIAGVRSARRRR